MADPLKGDQAWALYILNHRLISRYLIIHQLHHTTPLTIVALALKCNQTGEIPQSIGNPTEKNFKALEACPMKILMTLKP